ncbi:hypothetical protein FOZ60_003322 [Perkinsus olseni]|uniref:CCHC-type domain-containing protein n=1 Tax=Perkinsus olseni TaxID=32597 RepID=A0A7J6NWH4_PEROL|nr:hypothetical protein FOZ60_003322 [Perkinsus olseni]
MPFKLESVLEPYTGGEEDFALWLREFETVAEASKWSVKQKSHYIVLFMKGSAKDIARQALDEVDDGEAAAAYTHVVKALDNAFSLKTRDAWQLLTHREWCKEDTVDGVLAEFRRYLRVLGISTSVAVENILRESLLAALPEEVRKAIRMFDEDGRQLPLADVVVKARAQLKTRKVDKVLAAASVTGGQYCYICKATGHIASECNQRRSTSSPNPKGNERPKGKGKSKGPRCYNCQKYGHIARDCRSKKTGKAGAATEEGFTAAEQPTGGVVLHMGSEYAIGVDTGADYSLISSSFAASLAIPVRSDIPPIRLRLMDAVGVMDTVGQVDLPVTYLAKDGWVDVKHPCYVVDKTIFGPLVLGADFASRYCQGMTWNEDGRIEVPAAAAQKNYDDVQSYSLPDTPGVRVLEQPPTYPARGRRSSYQSWTLQYSRRYRIAILHPQGFDYDWSMATKPKLTGSCPSQSE